jgi:hypothetical protein
MSRENVEIVRVRLRRRHGEVVDDRQVLGRDRAAVARTSHLLRQADACQRPCAAARRARS